MCLSEISSYRKDKIDASLLSKKTYVGVDNLLQNRQGKTDSAYVPSVGNCDKYCTNDVLIGNIRPYLKKIWLADNDGGTNGDVLIVTSNKEYVLPRFLYYNLSSDYFFNYDVKYSKGAKMPRGDKASIMNFVIDLPSIDEQKKIVETLDKFDAYCNDLTEGLPAEIEARQKQYKYYRNKLLSFEIIEE